MDPARKKLLKSNYKKKPSVGGVYAIRCNETQRQWIKSTVDIDGIKNRFQFARSIQSCPDPVVDSEWIKYGTEAFSLVIFEELQMKENQTSEDFADEIKLLHEMWLEKLQAAVPD